MKGVYDEYADPSYCNNTVTGAVRNVRNAPSDLANSKEPIEKLTELDQDE